MHQPGVQEAVFRGRDARRPASAGAAKMSAQGRKYELLTRGYSVPVVNQTRQLLTNGRRRRKDELDPTSLRHHSEQTLAERSAADPPQVSTAAYPSRPAPARAAHGGLRHWTGQIPSARRRFPATACGRARRRAEPPSHPGPVSVHAGRGVTLSRSASAPAGNGAARTVRAPGRSSSKIGIGVAPVREEPFRQTARPVRLAPPLEHLRKEPRRAGEHPRMVDHTRQRLRPVPAQCGHGALRSPSSAQACPSVNAATVRTFQRCNATRSRSGPGPPPHRRAHAPQGPGRGPRGGVSSEKKLWSGRRPGVSGPARSRRRPACRRQPPG